jgi:hypothetical protein
MVGFLTDLLESRRSFEYLEYIRETKMIPPLLAARRLDSLLEERRKYSIMYNKFFIQQALQDSIIIYRELGARSIVNKLKAELEKNNAELQDDEKYRWVT